MKSLFLAAALLAVSSPAFADWKFESATLTEKSDFFSKELGLKIVTLIFTEPSCVPVNRFAKELKLENVDKDRYSVRIVAETNDEAAERQGITFPMCGDDNLVINFDAKDGTYDLEIDGVKYGAVVVKDKSAQLVN